MKKTLKKELNKHLFKGSLSLIVVFSVLFNTLQPEVVEAKGDFFAKISDFFKNNVAQAEETEEEVASFPDIEDAEPRKIVMAVMTAYSSDVGQTDSTPCIPADYKYNLCENYEKFGEQNTIAANFLPLGTKVRFPDLYVDKIFVVRDRMNARYGYGRGDIWMPTRNEAVNFGVKRVKMEIFYK
ncbi:MAG: hypothetical protein WC070_02805 [Candidatus Magasanikbacteria bacterium]